MSLIYLFLDSKYAGLRSLPMECLRVAFLDAPKLQIKDIIEQRD